MKKSDFHCFHRLRVRWAEVDMQKIVFNAHYLMYFDTAVSDYWRALALPYQESMDQLGGDLYVRKATLEYFASARIDDSLEVGIRCARIGTSSMLFEAALFRGDDLLVSGELVYVFADPATQTSKPVPPALREILTAFEAGAAVCEVRCGNWSELGEGAASLRREVFIEEQRVPEALEWDAYDATALHAVAVNRLGRAIATGRLLAEALDGVGRIGRLAVQRAMRGGGHGAAVLRALEAAAKARGDREIMLHAQCSAERFYQRLGYRVSGTPFEEAGIGHVEMRRAL